MFFCDNYFVPFALYFRKIIKKSKKYQRFRDSGSVFSGHVETKILKFSPASATKVRLPGRGGREGREGEGEGRGGEGEGKGREGKRRGKKEGEKGWGVSIWAPHFKMCCYGPYMQENSDIHQNSETTCKLDVISTFYLFQPTSHL